MEEENRYFQVLNDDEYFDKLRPRIFKSICKNKSKTCMWCFKCDESKEFKKKVYSEEFSNGGKFKTHKFYFYKKDEQNNKIKVYVIPRQYHLESISKMLHSSFIAVINTLKSNAEIQFYNDPDYNDFCCGIMLLFIYYGPEMVYTVCSCLAEVPDGDDIFKVFEDINKEKVCDFMEKII